MPYGQYYLIEKVHGGMCCGMTHIHYFPSEPRIILAAREKFSNSEWEEKLKTNTMWYVGVRNEAYPEQRGDERLKLMIKRVEHGQYDSAVGESRDGRPQGIIEVVLTTGQKTSWNDTLVELGFKEVNSNVNSNSTNTIHVYHRNSGQI